MNTDEHNQTWQDELNDRFGIQVMEDERCGSLRFEQWWIYPRLKEFIARRISEAYQLGIRDERDRSNFEENITDKYGH